METKPPAGKKSRLSLIQEGFAHLDVSKIPSNQTAIDINRMNFFLDGERYFANDEFNVEAGVAENTQHRIETIKEKISKTIDEKLLDVPEQIKTYVKKAANHNGGFSHRSASKTVEYFHEKGMELAIGHKRLDIIINVDRTLTVIEQFSIKAYTDNNEVYKTLNNEPIAYIITKSIISLNENADINHYLANDHVFLLDEQLGLSLFKENSHEARYGSTLEALKEEFQELINLKLAEVKLARAIATTTNEFFQMPAHKIILSLRSINKKMLDKEELSKLTSFIKSTTNLVNDFTLENLNKFTDKTVEILNINKPWAKKVGYAAVGVLGVSLVAASVTFAIYSAGIGPLVVAGIAIGVKTLFAASITTAALSALYSADGFYSMWKKQNKTIEAASELNKIAEKQIRKRN